MTEAEKKLLQAQHRLEEAQARDRVKERKMRTRRLIQEGAILEKVLPEVQTIELSELEGYLSRKLGKQIYISDRRSPGNRGPPSFFSRKGALTHHPEGQWYFLRKSCALRGECGCCGSLQTMPQHLRVLLPSSAQTAIPCDERSETGVDILYPCCRLPAQTCHRQLCRREGYHDAL